MCLRFRFLFSTLLLLKVFVLTSAFVDSYGRYKIKPNESETSELTEDDALFVTPYIEKGQIKKAQELATVPPMIKGIESFAGFLTVNKSCSSNLFFWLFKSQLKNWEDRPLVVSLGGGPGGSSLFELFNEIGPFSVTKEQRLKKRKYAWNRKYNLIFFDNPVGAGFSFTKSEAGYATNEVDVARDLYEALVQIYTLFPALQKNKLFITGESYAGKYIPAIGYRIFKANKVSSFKLPLAGLMIGNAWTDPVNMQGYAAYLYQLGLIDKNEKVKLGVVEENVKADIRAGKFIAARRDRIKEFDEIVKVTGLHDIYDFINDDFGAKDFKVDFINEPKTRKAIHVGTYRFNNGSKTYDHLEADIEQSVKPWVEELLTAEEFPIMFYSGQLDISVAYPLSLGFYRSLEWPHAKDYHDANRCQFKVGDDVAGYFKTAGTFTEVLVRNSGHAVPVKQPKWAFELLDRFISNVSSFECH